MTAPFIAFVRGRYAAIPIWGLIYMGALLPIFAIVGGWSGFLGGSVVFAGMLWVALFRVFPAVEINDDGVRLRRGYYSGPRVLRERFIRWSEVKCVIVSGADQVVIELHLKSAVPVLKSGIFSVFLYPPIFWLKRNRPRYYIPINRPSRDAVIRALRTRAPQGLEVVETS